jgi:transposase
MKKKRIYSAVDVEKFDVMPVIALLTVGCIVAIDVAKVKFVAAIATAAGEVLRLFRFEHPRQTAAFLRILVALRDAKLEPRVVMEPTGTYGDAIRYQCHRLEVPVHMMSPKHTHDFAEVLDGVPSMHDPKAAVALARLQAVRPAPQWQPASEARRDIRALLDERSPVSRMQEIYFGQLEAILARHWPELGTWVDVRQQRSWMVLLKEFTGPQAVTDSAQQAIETLGKASRGRFGAERCRAIVESARTTMGVPMTKGETALLRAVVESIAQTTQQLDAMDERLAGLAKGNAEFTKIAAVVGPACAAAILGHVGSPSAFSNAAALEKAMGLNLKERSSGEKKGRLSITKRGPAQVRQLLYLAAWRLIDHDKIAAAWYRGRKAYAREAKTAAVVALMRKLARALFHVARGQDFDARKLFDARRLGFAAKPPPASANASSPRLDAGGEATATA